MKPQDWVWLDKIMTPHQMKKIVKKIQDAANYALRLTALTADVIEFSVWRIVFADDPCESEAYEAPAKEKVEADTDEDDNDVLSDEDDGAPPPFSAPEGNFFFEGGSAASDIHADGIKGKAA